MHQTNFMFNAQVLAMNMHSPGSCDIHCVDACFVWVHMVCIALFSAIPCMTLYYCNSSRPIGLFVLSAWTDSGCPG